MSAERARAFWTVAPGVGEIREEKLPAPVDGEVFVRALFSGISRGSEALVFQGRVPPSEFERMRAPFQAGEFPAPVKYGYASVGVVEDGPTDLKGRHVFTLFPHQTAYVVPASAVHPVPLAVPPQRAIVAANLETAVNVLWDARPHVGDRIAVVGAGTVGCLTAWLASRITACSVELIDVNPARASIAPVLGVRVASPDRASTDVDLVVHTSGAASGLDVALRLAGFEATIVDASWYGDGVVPAALGGAFHSKRLTLQSSQVGHVASSQRARWDTRRRMTLALSMLADPTLDVLITGESAFDDLPRVMPELAARPGGALCHRIRY